MAGLDMNLDPLKNEKELENKLPNSLQNTVDHIILRSGTKNRD
jgi:hypothetical protein